MQMQGLEAYQAGTAVWVPDKGATTELSKFTSGKAARWVRGSVQSVVQPSPGVFVLNVQTEENILLKGLSPQDCPLQNERDDTVDDLVRSDFLHEPG